MGGAEGPLPCGDTATTSAAVPAPRGEVPAPSRVRGDQDPFGTAAALNKALHWGGLAGGMRCSCPGCS